MVTGVWKENRLFAVASLFQKDVGVGIYIGFDMKANFVAAVKLSLIGNVTDAPISVQLDPILYTCVYLRGGLIELFIKQALSSFLFREDRQGEGARECQQ